MSSFSDYLENKILDHVFNNVAYTSPAVVYMALFTVAPTDAGGGTEVAGSGYARQAVAFGASAAGAIANSALETWTAAGGNYGNVVAVAFFDAATVGNMLSWAAITPATVNDTDTLDFEIGSVDITLD